MKTEMNLEQLKREIKKEWLYDRSEKIIDALASIDYYGNTDLKKFCLDQSRQTVKSLASA